MSTAPESLTDPEGGAVEVALLDEDCLVCNAELEASPTSAADPGALRIRARIVPPKLERKVDPAYPQKARDARLEGRVVYQAIISPTGCVREIRLVKRVDLILDLAGLAALARWRYTPATLDGQAVPVYLTVTVTFNLHR
jgi:protein TonB